jgi:hypothetical protein
LLGGQTQAAHPLPTPRAMAWKPPEKGFPAHYGCVSYVPEHLSMICPG